MQLWWRLRSAVNTRALTFLEDSTIHDFCCYHVGMLWDDAEQLRSPTCTASVVTAPASERSQSQWDLSKKYSRMFLEQLDHKTWKISCFNKEKPRKWYLPQHLVLHSEKLGKAQLLNSYLLSKLPWPFTEHRSFVRPRLTSMLTLNPVILLSRHHQWYAVSQKIERKLSQVGKLPMNEAFLRFWRREDPGKNYAVS